MTGRIVSPASLALATLLAVLAAAPALACPPTLTVGVPAQGSRTDGALIVLHAGRGCHPGPLTVTGTAEGLEGGARRSIALSVEPTDTDGVFIVRREWPRGRAWVLRLVARVGDGSATALVGLDASGRVAAVLQQDRYRREVPVITDADVERMLHSLAS